MISKSPRILLLLFLVFFSFAWLYNTGDSSSVSRPLSHPPPTSPESHSNSDDVDEPRPASKPPKVHYADMPDPPADETQTSTTSTSKIPAPTTNPVFKRRTPFGYVFYATDDNYACSAAINIARLKSFRTPHDIYILLTDRVSKEYKTYFENLNVTVAVTPPPAHPHPHNTPQEKALLKLYGFRMHRLYDQNLKRVIVIDSDQYIYKPLDSLFSLPSADLAAPRAYWQGKGMLSTTLMVISLSDRTWQAVENTIKTLKEGQSTLELVNELFQDTAMTLPGQYATKDSHFVEWDVPKWYRPEGDFHAQGMVSDYSKAELKDLWRVINENVETDDEQKRLTAAAKPAIAKLRKRGEPEEEENEDEEENNEEEDTKEPEQEKKAEPKQQEKPDAAQQKLKQQQLLQQQKLQQQKLQAQQRMQQQLQAQQAAAQRQRQQAAAPGVGIPHSQGGPPPGVLVGTNGHPPVPAKPVEPPKPPPHPYSPDNHPNRGPLSGLFDSAVVVHIGASYKPWAIDLDGFKRQKKNFHPAIFTLYENWRVDAHNVCPRVKKFIPEKERKPGGPKFEMFHPVNNV